MSIKQSIRLCKEDYCVINQVKDPSSIEFEYLNKDKFDNPVFRVTDIKLNKTFNHTSVKKDISFLTDLKTVRFDRKTQLSLDFLNKSMICNYLNSKIGLGILPTDISLFQMTSLGLNIIIDLDSMRFKNTCIIKYDDL